MGADKSFLELFLGIYRKKLGLTREEMAHRVGCPLSEFIDVEEGRIALSRGDGFTSGGSIADHR